MKKAILGRAGVHLVIFQLCRRGIECMETPHSSQFGDIWANVDSGSVRIEVKAATSNYAWILKPGQISSDFFCFVELLEGQCWILTRDEVLTIASNYKIDPANGVPVTSKYLPSGSFEAWEKLGGEKMRQFFSLDKGTRGGKAYTSTRVVRQKMADGTIKEYRYPGTKEKAQAAARLSGHHPPNAAVSSGG